MNFHDIIKPIGLDVVCDEIQSVCDNATLFQRFKIVPRPLIIPLDSGCGRTTLIEYMADMYKIHRVLPFDSGLDDYIELALDGTLPQLHRSFASIQSAAVFQNDYTGILSMDISALAPRLNETQWTEFSTLIKPVCVHACLVFFVHSQPCANEERVISKLFDLVAGLKRLPFVPYSQKDLSNILLRMLENYGVSVLAEDSLLMPIIQDIISLRKVSHVKEITPIVREVLSFADLTGFTPCIDSSAFLAWAEHYRSDAKKGERV